MIKKEQHKRRIIFLISVVLVLCLTGIFAGVWYSCYAYSEEILMEPFFRRGNYVVIAQYALMSFFFQKLFGNFKIGYLRIFETVYAQIVTVLCTNFVTYLQLCLIGRWAFLEYITPILYMTAIDCVLVTVWVFLTRYIYVKIYPSRELLLIYGEYSPDRLIDKLSSQDGKYRVKETISIDVDVEEIIAKLESYEGVVLADIPADIRNQLLKECFARSIRCYSIPKISDILIMNAESIHLFDTALLLFRNGGLSMSQQFWKRIMDIVLSLTGLIVLSPLMFLIAIGIKCSDGGSVFFLQERLTRDGDVFRIIKFRSMKMNADRDGVCMTRKDDDRVTAIGRILRASHLDELPQLLNILKGDMSIVGPRPECPEIAKEYEKFLPEFPFRLKVKAGLTGYAQVYGKYNTTPYDKLKLDLRYIEKYSLLLDIKLIILTIRFFFKSDKTEGIENWQETAATRENLKRVDNNEQPNA